MPPQTHGTHQTFFADRTILEGSTHIKAVASEALVAIRILRQFALDVVGVNSALLDRRQSIVLLAE
eukprot:8779134-Pyramimonas_sp.AAC.1